MHARRGIRSGVGPGAEWLPLSAASLTTLLSVAYIGLIRIEDESDYARVAFVAVALAAAAGCLLATAAIQPLRLRLALAAFAATTLVILAFLALMSIGLLLAVPALLAVATCGRIAGSTPSGTTVAISIVSGVASVMALALGFMTT